MLLVWREKRRQDAIRPTSLINHLYRDRTIRIWGGPGKGTVQMNGKTFTHYIGVQPHQGYPSASARFCQYYADIISLFVKTSKVKIDRVIKAGSSKIKPSLPSKDFTIKIRDLQKDIADSCSESRINAGLHFRPAVTEGRRLVEGIAEEIFQRVACLAPTNDMLPLCKDPRFGEEYQN